MSARPPELPLDRVAPVAAPGVRILPVVHDSVECAAVARAVLDRLDPAGVAIELPRPLAAAVEVAVARLPRVTLVVSEEPGEDALVWVCAPAEPFAEVLRWARERGRPRFLVDPDLPYGERHRDPVPDSYSVWALGAGRYLDLVAEACGRVAGAADEAREAGMAYHVREAREQLAGGELLVVVGAAHARRLAERLAAPLAVPLGRVRRATTELAHLHPESLSALLPEPPLAHAVWESRRGGTLPPPTVFERTVAPRVVLERHGLRLLAGGSAAELAEREHELVAYAARHAARPLEGGCAAPDRWALGRLAFRVAAASYREQTEGTVAPWQRRLFLDYARRYARVEGRLVPGIYEWTVAARGVGDDNLGWELFDALRAYPWQPVEAELPTARVDGDELELGTRRLRFRRRFLRTKRRPVALPLRRHPRPEDPDEWLRAFADGGLCSYPPEDLVVEDYGRYLRHKAVALLSAERERSEPFTGSFLDGIDLRETLRHRGDDGRVRVRELGRVPGEAGSLVVIFDRDRPAPDGAERFPHRMTWHGEHHQESDMAFYSTDPAAQVVGPGILRATYGGFLLVHPPGRLWDVWSDPDYRFTRDKAETLLAAAIDYSLGRLVVHVGRDQPPEALRRRAAQQGKRVLHVPLGALSPATLRKVRVVHLLAGRDKRAIARDYLW